MDEYLIADSFLALEPIEKAVDLSSYNKIPLASMIGFGGGIPELAKTLQTETGLFKAYNPKTGEQLLKLPYNSKQMLGAQVGALVQPNGSFDQAAFKAVPGVAAVNPAVVAAAIGIALVIKKLDGIEETQNRILNFLEVDKRTQIEGTLNYLLSVYNDYKFNWNSEMFRTTAHTKVRDAKEKAEQSFLFYKEQVENLLSKKRLFATSRDIEKNTKAIFDQLVGYRLAVYLYSFSSLLEVLLLENYGSSFLTELSNRIRAISYDYSDLYSKCYTLLSEAAGKTLNSGIMTGVAAAAKITGKLINKIPLVERGPVDEALISAGDKLDKYRIINTDKIVDDLPLISNPSTAQFAEVVDSINKLHNAPIEIAVDEENLYVKMAS